MSKCCHPNPRYCRTNIWSEAEEIGLLTIAGIITEFKERCFCLFLFLFFLQAKYSESYLIMILSVCSLERNKTPISEKKIHRKESCEEGGSYPPCFWPYVLFRYKNTITTNALKIHIYVLEYTQGQAFDPCPLEKPKLMFMIQRPHELNLHLSLHYKAYPVAKEYDYSSRWGF